MLFETFAVTGGKPKASRVGKVISVPEPTTALMAPAATPARAMATISYQGTGRPYKRWPGGPTSGPVLGIPGRRSAGALGIRRTSVSWAAPVRRTIGQLGRSGS